LQLSIEVGPISAYLANIEVGGPGAITRVFLTIKDGWLESILPLPDFQQDGVMVGASHGNVSTFTYEYVRQIDAVSFPKHVLRAIDSPDPIIRGTARWAESNNGTGLAGFVDDVTLFSMNATLTGGGKDLLVPGPLSGDSSVFGPPETVTTEFMNGYTSLTDIGKPPLDGFAADGTRFFASAKEIPVGYNGADGTWIVTVVIDREYVLGATDRQQRQTQDAIRDATARVAADVARDEAAVAAEVEESNKKVQDDLDQDRMILYIAVGVTAVVLMVISVIFVMRIVAPLLELKADMSEVAVMKLENVDEHRPLSLLEEVRAMESSFKQMIANLREYRSYMPASVLMDDEEEDEDEVSESGASESVSRSESKVASRRQSSTGKSSTMASGKASTQKSKMTKQEIIKGKAAAMAVNLVKKKAAFLSLNVTDFSGLAVTVRPDVVIEAIKVYLQKVVDIVQKSKGVPDGFNGDRVYASFAAVRPCGTPRAIASVAAYDCTEQGQAALNTMLPIDDGMARGQVVAGVAGGDSLCGNVGTDMMKKFCCIGLATGNAHVCCQVNIQWLTAAICDYSCITEAKNVLNVRRLVPTNRRGVSLGMAQILGKKEVGEDEWMYQMEEGEKNDPTKLFNAAVELFAQGEVEKAIAGIQEDATKNPSKQHNIAIELMKAHLSAAPL